jgi:hypothetical protein
MADTADFQPGRGAYRRPDFETTHSNTMGIIGCVTSTVTRDELAMSDPRKFEQHYPHPHSIQLGQAWHGF